MKMIAQLLLFVFVSFLITPAVISAMERNADMSSFYGFTEEEKAQKEIQAIISVEFASTPVDLSQLNSLSFFSKSVSKHDTIFSKIFIPPPKQV
ncbi:MAG TPA: hypothetical protein DCM02_12730 [Flavobacterium sp.]|nr:hypothetical protein [Flavobacterium sp.]HAT76870.1 hypothetical protein [Flavobacterium sp.]HAT80621.1 hypothetical protein [Flavobacterium sp.]